MSSGCGCKEVYKYPHITYPYSLYLLFFAAASLHFCNFSKCFSFLCIIESVDSVSRDERDAP